MLDKEVFHHTRYVHLGVMRPQLMLDICRYCKENTNAIVSIDSGNLSRENTDMLLPYADIFIPDNKTVERTLHMSEPDACRYYARAGRRSPALQLRSAAPMPMTAKRCTMCRRRL